MSSGSPKIQDVEWGSISVEGVDGTYKDAKLWPGGSREWDWNETGTRHVPGVQPADVEEILEKGVETVVIGRGMVGALRVTEETRAAVEAAGAALEVAPTGEAVQRYNQLRRSGPVGGLFHTTC